jgi:hypothetical protein
VKDVTAHEAYLVMYPLLKANDLLEVCHPLVEFLQVASTQPTAGNPCQFTLQDRLGTFSHPVQPIVINQLRTMVRCHLMLVLTPTNQGRLPDKFAETLADGKAKITVEMHANQCAREIRVSDSVRPKTSREKYGDRIANIILIITSSSNDDLIPHF